MKKHLRLVAFLPMFVAANAFSASSAWDVVSGSWNNAANWSGGVPVADSSVMINNSGTAEVSTGVSASYGSLFTGSNANGNLIVTGGLLSGTHSYIGYAGAGSVVVSGGTFAALTQYIVGSTSSGVGTLSITGGSVQFGNAGLTIGQQAGSRGTVAISSGSLTGSTPIVVGQFGNGSFQMTGGTVSARLARVGQYLGSSGTLTMSGGTLTNTGFAMLIGESGSGTLVVNGGVINASSGTGFIVGSGTTSVGSASFASGTLSTTNLVVGSAGAGTLNLNGGRVTVSSTLTIASGSSSSGTLNLNSGALLELGGNGALATGSGTSAVNFSGGTLRVISSSLFSSAKVALSGTSVIDTNGFGATFSNRLSGSGGLAKVGDGTLALSGSNTYLGETIVSDGMVLVMGDSSGASGDVTVESGAGLGGTGTIGGAVSVLSGGTLAPGSSPGQLTLLNDLTMNAGSLLEMEFSGTGAGEFDQLDVQGAFAAGGTLNLHIDVGFTPLAGSSFLIFNGSTPGFDTGSFAITTNLGPGLSWDITQLQSDGIITVVPEPGTCTLVGLGLAGVLLAMRRRRRAAGESGGS